MPKRVTEADYEFYKRTIVTAKKRGQKLNEIRDFLQIGNGTATYVDRSKNYADYKAIVKEVIDTSILKRKAIEAAKAVQPVAPKRRGRPPKAKVVAEPTDFVPTPKIETPLYPLTADVVAKIVDARIDELKVFLKGAFMIDLLDNFKKECVNDICTEVEFNVNKAISKGELVPSGTAGKQSSWWKTKS